MNNSLVADANQDIAALIDAWCDRRAIDPLRIALSCYPIPNNLTDDWAAVAASLKTIRARFGRDLPPEELDTVVRIQQLAESIVYR